MSSECSLDVQIKGLKAGGVRLAPSSQQHESRQEVGGRRRRPHRLQGLAGSVDPGRRGRRPPADGGPVHFFGGHRRHPHAAGATGHPQGGHRYSQQGGTLFKQLCMIPISDCFMWKIIEFINLDKINLQNICAHPRLLMANVDLYSSVSQNLYTNT